MSDPRNVAHDKRVTQEKKHHAAAAVTLDDAPAVQPGKKSAAAKSKSEPGEGTTHGDQPAAGGNAGPSASKAPVAALEGSLVVLSKLKELEFHSRAHLERLAELTMAVDDELKQTAFAVPLGEVYSAQNRVQTGLTALIETYTIECDRLQGDSSS